MERFEHDNGNRQTGKVACYLLILEMETELRLLTSWLMGLGEPPLESGVRRLELLKLPQGPSALHWRELVIPSIGAGARFLRVEGRPVDSEVPSQ